MNRTPKRPPKPGIGIPTDDRERAKRFCDYLDGGCSYIKAWNQWVHWDDNQWVIDDMGVIINRKAMDFAEEILDEAKAQPVSGPAQQTDLANAKKLSSATVIEHMIRLLKSLQGIS